MVARKTWRPHRHYRSWLIGLAAVAEGVENDIHASDVIAETIVPYADAPLALALGHAGKLAMSWPPGAIHDQPLPQLYLDI